MFKFGLNNEVLKPGKYKIKHPTRIQYLYKSIDGSVLRCCRTQEKWLLCLLIISTSVQTADFEYFSLR